MATDLSKLWLQLHKVDSVEIPVGPVSEIQPQLQLSDKASQNADQDR